MTVDQALAEVMRLTYGPADAAGPVRDVLVDLWQDARDEGSQSGREDAALS